MIYLILGKQKKTHLRRQHTQSDDVVVINTAMQLHKWFMCVCVCLCVCVCVCIHKWDENDIDKNIFLSTPLRQLSDK